MSHDDALPASSTFAVVDPHRLSRLAADVLCALAFSAAAAVGAEVLSFHYTDFASRRGRLMWCIEGEQERVRFLLEIDLERLWSAPAGFAALKSEVALIMRDQRRRWLAEDEMTR